MPQLPTLSVLLAFAALLPAQADVRELATPVDYEILLDATAAQLTSTINNGYRIVDLEVRSSTPTFAAKLVRNSGAYAAGWWWYYDLTASQVGSFLTQNQARLIDLEPYDNGSGSLRFACVMVDNTGANAKAFWWYYNTTTTNIGNQVTANNARIVDLDEYRIGSTTYYSAVMIANTGSDNRAWWWYLNVTPAQIGTYLNQNQARIYDLERRSGGNYDVVMIRDVQPRTWWWWVGLTSPAQVQSVLANHGARAIDVETYTVQVGPLLARRYDVVAINNSNVLTTAIGIDMRARTTGTVGAWLDDFGTQSTAPKLADLNGGTPFEPASTMKTLHHVHAMRQALLGTIQLSTSIQVFTAMNGSCPIDSNPTNESLQLVLRLMMENSDNARTQAVAARFGTSAINGTASSLGMTDTSLNHRIGCSEALTNPNRITLRDLSTLHRRVATGYLGSFRDTFYELMLDNIADLSLAAIIDQEAANFGLSSATRSTFRSLTRMAHKGGNYRWPSVPLFHRAEFGWLSLPFISGNAVMQREYGFGAFVNDATDDDAASNAIYTDAIPALLRDRVRAAMQTWVGALATVTSFGTGCGSPTPCTQDFSGLPRLGATIQYRASNGFPNSLALLVLGFSSSSWNGLPLPLNLEPFGSDPGCAARIDSAASEARIASSGGAASFSLQVPNTSSLIGTGLLTQWYSFGPVTFRASNALRSVVGL